MVSSPLSKRPYLYAVKPSPEASIVTGQLAGEDMESVRVGLAKLLGFRTLPENTIIMDKADVDAEGDKAWQLARTMLSYSDLRTDGSKGLQGSFRDRRPAPERHEPAEAVHPNWKSILRILTRHNEWLNDPNSGERAYLTGMILTGINLSDRVLSQAHMSYADLSGADLSDADLRDTVLLDANLKGADLWRANIKGMTIKARALHQAFECRTK